MTDDLAATLDELRGSWRRASDHDEVAVRSIELAGQHLRIEAAGDHVLTPLWSALAHHPEATGEPDLTLRLWHLAGTGDPPPPLPEEMFVRPGELLDTLVTDGAYLRFEPGGQMLSAYVPAEREAWCCVADIAAVAWWDRAAPFRSLLAWWLAAHDVQLAHGAAVGGPDGAVVLVGPGGSGKSTTALTALLGGMGYLGDDYCAVSSRPDPRVHSLYSSAKLVLDSDLVDRFADRLLHRPGPGAKAVVGLHGDLSSQLVEQAPVRAVLATRVAGSPTSTFEPVPRARVLASLAPSSMLQLKGIPANVLTGMASLVRRAPVVGRLHLGRDRDQLVGLLTELLGGEVAA